MRTMTCLLISSLVLQLQTYNTYGGDDEWRTFGEAAAVLLGVRALTGWDPVGKLVDYPRKRYISHRYQDRREVINAHTHQPRNQRISAYPDYSKRTTMTYGQNTPSETEYSKSQSPIPEFDRPDSQGNTNDRQPEFYQPPKSRDSSKPTIEIKKYIEGDYEITEKKIWIAEHWEKKVIEGHWRGDTWVDQHSERKWIAGEWKTEEEKHLIEKE